ncbi:MAG: transcriptional regulator GcvA [Paraglaciecola sp.]|nr:transcriptional regulator GcvA [Paraglaciecola sp.]
MRKKMPLLNSLKSFEAAARHLSFRDAADELCVSVSAVSHQVKQLEHALNIELFIRKTRAVELTKIGKQYYPILRDAFDKIAEGTYLILKPTRSDVLTIQLYSTLAIRWLIPRLPDFQKKHPKISVRLNTSQLDVDFDQSDVDACVMIGHRMAKGLHYSYLFSSDVFPVCSPKLLEGKDRLQQPDELNQYTLLQVYPSERDWYIWLDGVGCTTVDPESGLQFDNYDHSISTALQGMGIALGMQPYVGKELSSGMLIEPFPEMRVKHHSEWYFVYRQEKFEQKKIQLFESWLIEQIEADPELAASRESNK